MEGTSPQLHTLGWPLEVAVFVCGALVMIFEINGSRIVAPFLGNSTYIWTSLIGVILAALSVGYWFGGRVADKRPLSGILAAVLFTAGGLVSVTVLVNEIALSMIASAPLGLSVKSLIASIALFAPTSILFGFVLPFAVRLRMRSVSDSGKTVGRLYALSTVGSITGTFAAGFLLIPFVGSLRTLYIVAGTLFLLGLLLAPFALTRTNIASILFFVAAIAASEGFRSYRYASSRFIDIDTEYARLSVFDTTDPRSGRPIRAIANDPYFLQSAMYLDGDDLVFEYTRFFHIANAFVPEIRRSLMIGAAGYSFPRDYLREHPTAMMDVVEIDSQMTQIAREHFRLMEDPRLNIFHEDARMFVQKAERGYDVVYMDAFGSLFSVPTHLTTKEFFASLAKTLNENGVLVMNLGGSLAGDGSSFALAEIATIRSVFPFLRIFKVNAARPDEELQNIVIVARKTSHAGLLVHREIRLARLLENEIAVPDAMNATVMTDDLAPVEYYNSVAQEAFIARRGR